MHCIFLKISLKEKIFASRLLGNYIRGACLMFSPHIRSQWQIHKQLSLCMGSLAPSHSALFPAFALEADPCQLAYGWI